MSMQESMKEGWYLLRSKPRQEQRAEENLDNQGFDVFCPVIRHSSAGKNVKEEALFPGYLFLYLDLKDLEQYYKISSTRGVLDIVRFDHVTRHLYADGRIAANAVNNKKVLPQPIPNGDKVIEQVKGIITFLESPSLGTDFTEGDTVTICNPLYEHLKTTFVKGISMDRGLVLIQFITEQRNAEGRIEKANAVPVKTMTVKLSDLKKADEHQRY